MYALLKGKNDADGYCLGAFLSKDRKYFAFSGFENI